MSWVESLGKCGILEVEEGDFVVKTWTTWTVWTDVDSEGDNALIAVDAV